MDVTKIHIESKELPGSGFDVSAIPGLSDLWAETLGDPRICVAILDGPADLTHPSLARANLTHIDPVATCAATTGPAAEHGTHVASVIFGQHDGLVTGIAPQCRGVILPIYRDQDDRAVVPCSQLQLAQAITRAIEFAEKEGVESLVINISGGQFSPSGEAHPMLVDVVRKCDRTKVLIVAAAGNEGCDCLHIPSAIPSVLAVGAMNIQGNPLDFSNWGSSYQTQGVLALGENIIGASPSREVAVSSGTSYATPIVSGIAALLLCLQLRQGIVPSASAVRDVILRSALGCEYEVVADCRRLLAGRLFIPGAIARLTSKGQVSMSQNSELGVCNMLETAFPQGDVRLAVANDSSQSSATVIPSPPIATYPAVDSPEAGLVMPSDCGCGGKKSGPALQKVYAIGKLGFDYGTRQRREYFRNRIGGDPDNEANLYNYLTDRPPLQVIDKKGHPVVEGKQPVFTTRQGASDLRLDPNAVDLRLPHCKILNGPQFANRADVTALTWILKIDETPIYAISPMGAFAADIHDTLVAFLQDQLTSAQGGEQVERMAIPGVIIGETRLFMGEQIPVLAPDHRGMANWTTSALLAALQAIIKAEDAIVKVRDILERMYELTRNLGVSSQDRALNYAATDALQMQGILADPLNQERFAGLELDTITVDKSPICRPDYDCWDVVITFYNPKSLIEARRGVRYTIDVSDVMPHVVAGSQRVFTLR